MENWHNFTLSSAQVEELSGLFYDLENLEGKKLSPEISAFWSALIREQNEAPIAQ